MPKLRLLCLAGAALLALAAPGFAQTATTPPTDTPPGDGAGAGVPRPAGSAETEGVSAPRASDVSGTTKRPGTGGSGSSDPGTTGPASPGPQGKVGGPLGSDLGTVTTPPPAGAGRPANPLGTGGSSSTR
jgi:hypothetical protein